MLSARLAQALQKLGHKGALALVWGGAVGILAALGMGLLTAALLMAMATLIGAIWAAALLGLICVALAAGLIALRKEQRPPPPVPAQPLEEIVFTLAFVAARAFLRKDP